MLRVGRQKRSKSSVGVAQDSSVLHSSCPNLLKVFSGDDAASSRISRFARSLSPDPDPSEPMKNITKYKPRKSSPSTSSNDFIDGPAKSPKLSKFNMFSDWFNRRSSAPATGVPALRKISKTDVDSIEEDSEETLSQIGPSPVCIVVSCTGEEVSTNLKSLHEFGSIGNLLEGSEELTSMSYKNRLGKSLQQVSEIRTLSESVCDFAKKKKSKCDIFSFSWYVILTVTSNNSTCVREFLPTICCCQFLGDIVSPSSFCKIELKVL